MLMLLLLLLMIIAHSGEPRISVGPELMPLRSRLRRGCLCGGLLRVRCSCHIMLRVIIRRRLLVVVVVVIRGRHLARIEGLLVPHILVTNAMHDGRGGGGEIENGWWWQDEGSLSEKFGDKCDAKRRPMPIFSIPARQHEILLIDPREAQAPPSSSLQSTGLLSAATSFHCI